MFSRALSFLAIYFVLVAPSVLAAPVPASSSLGRRATFVVQDYSKFQISSGTAGNAQAQANAVFVTPFAGRDLSTVTQAELDAINTMREAAESAETDLFNPQITAAGASTAAGIALQNGKIKNKVLKLTAEVQSFAIKIAQDTAAGKSTTSDTASQATEQKKLTTNIALDVKAAGQASQAATPA